MGKLSLTTVIHRRRRVPVVASLVSTLLTTPALAQVGHDPARSPYRDIPRGHSVTVLGGYIGGGGGRFGIAPHSGSGFGLRYDIRTSSAVQVGIGVARAELERRIVDPFVVLAERDQGIVPQTVTVAEFDLQLNLTGGKTWHRLAPFVGSAAGVTFPSGTPADTSGFEFGRKFYVAPHAGVRAFITSRLHLRGEVRAMFWKLKYPPSFEAEPPDEPGDPPSNSNAVIQDGRVSEWTATSWLQVGLGYSFSL
ncbi:MAG: hypothetical protein ACREMG_08290 [Gemmatimonadales bacterium]